LPQAIALCRDLLTWAPGVAEAHYRVAGLLAQERTWDESHGHYVLARQYHDLPIRSTEDLREVYRALARGHHVVMAVDSAQIFEALSPHGIFGRDFYRCYDPVDRLRKAEELRRATAAIADGMSPEKALGMILASSGSTNSVSFPT
jgi:hypothetical protein